jgi:hypothetical protein
VIADVNDAFAAALFDFDDFDSVSILNGAASSSGNAKRLLGDREVA